MKIRMIAVMVTLLALLPFAAEAQRGGGGSRGGSSSSGGGARSTGGATRSAGNTVRAPRNNSNHSNSNHNQPRNQAIPRGHNQPRNNASVSPRTFVTNRPVNEFHGNGNYVATGTFHHRGWWPGGFFWGVSYGPGWYYSMGFYPGFWYYGSYGYGYQYSVGEPSDLSGIKFDLDQIPKDERKAVENGNVLLDGDGATNGRVKNFSGLGRGKVLLLGPGDHDITVRIKGGQEIAMSVAVRAGHVTHIALNFDQARKDGQQPADVSLEKPGSAPIPTLMPAPSESLKQ